MRQILGTSLLIDMSKLHTVKKCIYTYFNFRLIFISTYISTRKFFHAHYRNRIIFVILGKHVCLSKDELNHGNLISHNDILTIQTNLPTDIYKNTHTRCVQILTRLHLYSARSKLIRNETLIYIKIVVLSFSTLILASLLINLLWFYDISTIVGYSKPNPLNEYLLDIDDL